MDDRRRVLAGPDSAWWHMDGAGNDMVITAVLTFEDPVDPERLRVLVRDRLLRHEAFRRRIEEPALGIGRPRWVEDGGPSLDHHVQGVSLPAPGDRAALEDLVGTLMSEPLDPARPLWRFHLVEEYAGGSALVARLHHCIGDGIALIHLLLTLDDIPGNESVATTWAAARALRVRALPARERALLVAAVALDVGRLLLMPFDRPGPLRGRLTGRKRATWSEPVPLEDLRARAREQQATVHDVAAAAVAGALRAHLVRAGMEPLPASLRAVVPVNLRAVHDVGELGNRFGLLFLPLPVGRRDGAERLREVKRSMDRLKRSPEAWVVYALLHLFGRLPKWVQWPLVRFLGRKASLVVTDLPGPREAIRFCGSRVTDLMAWVPQAGRLGLGVSILSYDGRVRVGVTSDAGVVADPEPLARDIHRTLANLGEGAAVAPAKAG